MSRDDQDRIDDIFEFATRLELYVAKGYGEFLADDGSELAIERLIELIGEAASHLSEAFKEKFPIIPWSEIAGMRVLLAHAYHRVDFEIVWIAATESIPEFIVQLKKK